MSLKRDFKGVWIPKWLWESKELTLQEKVFFVEIDSLDNEDGCFANNKHFAEFFDVSVTRVSEVINSLVSKGYVSSVIDQANGNRRILRSQYKEDARGVLKKPLRGSSRKVEEGLKDSFMHSNTFNNTFNTTTTMGGTRPPKTHSPLTTSSSELNIWLDAISIAAGGGTLALLPNAKRWERICMDLIRKDESLQKLLKVIEQEKKRTANTPEFFSADGCLKQFQAAKNNAEQSKWMHSV